MQQEDILDLIINSDHPLSPQQLIDLILPGKRDEVYSFSEIDVCLRGIYERIEQTQREHNNKFDATLDGAAQEKLKNLCQDLQKTQHDVLKLQCNIAHAKEQYNIVQTDCSSDLVQEHRNLLIEESNLKKSLQESKFQSVKEFFTTFVDHLGHTIDTSRKLLAQHANLYLQSFDWAHYHRAMFILRACGKMMIDIDKVERLYQSDSVNFFGISFKQSLKDLDLNHFIEFHSTYSLETQAVIIFDQQQQQQPGQRCDFGQFLADETNQHIFKSTEPITYELLLSQLAHLQTASVACCRLVIDMNLNYIEAQFTDGINIEKLNGCDSAQQTVTSSSEQTLPLYAFSPQEYITQIGQHLLTLRKQTDKIGQSEAEPLTMALNSIEQAQDMPMDVKSCKSVTEIMLKCIARHCIRSLIARTGPNVLSRLTTNGRRQLATDVMYLDNVLEDLNLLGPSEPNVEKFKSLFAQ